LVERLSIRNAQSGAAGGTAHRPGLRWVVALAVIALTIAPWTYRNALVTGRFIPVHSGGVTQFVKGNLEFEHYHEAPLQSTQLARIAETRLAQMLGLSGQFDVRSEGLDQALLPFAVESLSHQLDRVLAKVAVQVLRFWYLSDTALKSWVLAVCQIPLLVLAAVGAVCGLRARRQAWPAMLVLLASILYFNLIYAALHVEGRYSTPVAPLIIVLAVAGCQAIVRLLHKETSHG
jgi:hypothetical protein